MGEDLHPDDYQEGIIVPTTQTDLCCPEGLRAFRDFDWAYLHRNDPDSRITSKLLRRLERREQVALGCHRVGDTGECALKAAGLFEAYPEQ